MPSPHPHNNSGWYPNPLLGNDIVDLHDPETAAGSLHPRFDERVFSPTERRCLTAHPDRDRLRWILWAAKEAAYKATRKLSAAVIFSPPSFVVDLDARVVHWGGKTLALTADVNNDRVHAMAFTSEVPKETLHEVEIVRASSPQGAVRNLARRALASYLGTTLQEIEFGYNQKIPFPIVGGQRIQMDLSFSHHGRFVAFAAILPEGS